MKSPLGCLAWLIVAALIVWGALALKAMADRHAARGETSALDAMFLP